VLSQSFKKQCVALREAGFSINEIAERTGRTKSSIHYHIKNIPLPERRLREIRKKSTERIVSFNKERRGKSALNRHVKHFSTWKPSHVRLVAHLAFDGEIRQTGCIYHNRSKALVKQVEKDMLLLYAHPPRKYEQKSGVARLCYFNVELGSYVEKKAVELFENIDTSSKTCQREFIRAFFDDEGCVSIGAKENRRRVRGYQNDTATLLLIKKLLSNFRIDSYLSSKNKELVIGRRNDLIRFRDEINFSPGVYINGNRSNSIWRKSYEKRHLLDMAINSYKN
jgi:hypothetical protein